MRNSKLKICLTFLVGLTASTHATSLQEALEQLTGDAAKKYVSPIVSGIGADLNAGWYHRAPPAKKFKFTLEGGALGMVSFLDGGTKSFSTNQSFRFDSTQSSTLIGGTIDTTRHVSGSTTLAGIQDSIRVVYAKNFRAALVDTIRSKDFGVSLFGPTVIGTFDDTVKARFTPPAGGIAVNANGIDTIIMIPADTIAIKGVTGILGDLSPLVVPLIAPQLTVGTVYGTNLTLRWLPTMPAGDIGDFSFFGFGIQHNPAVWLGTSIPVDFCVGYFHQELKVGSLFDASTNAYGVDVSKQFGWRIFNVTPYAGFQYETSTMSFHYDFKQSVKDPTTGKVNTTRIPVKFDLEGENNTRLTAGLSIRLLFLNLNADYNVAKYPSASIGVMFGI